jgi:kynurenine formamidase
MKYHRGFALPEKDEEYIMRVIDITGPIYNGMWYFGDPWPRFHFQSRQHLLEGVGITALIENFEGMGGHTGLHIETPATGIGYEKSYPLIDVPIEKLVLADAYVLQIPHDRLPVKDGKPFISLEALKAAEKEEIPEGAVILIGTGYGKNWDRDDYLSKSWFIKREAMYYIIDRKPLLLGVDATDFENWVNPEGFFKRFFNSDILLMAPCINLEKVRHFKVKFIALPLKIRDAAICPTRAVILEE